MIRLDGTVTTITTDGYPVNDVLVAVGDDGTAYLVTRTGDGSAAHPYVYTITRISLAPPPPVVV